MKPACVVLYAELRTVGPVHRANPGNHPGCVGRGGSGSRRQGDTNRNGRGPHHHQRPWMAPIVLTNLAIGPYRLEISKPHFNTYVRTGIVLQVESQPTMDVSLKVGDVTRAVEVDSQRRVGGNAIDRHRQRD